MRYYISASGSSELFSIGVLSEDNRSLYFEFDGYSATANTTEHQARIANLRRSNADTSAVRTFSEVVDEIETLLDGDSSPVLYIYYRSYEVPHIFQLVDALLIRQVETVNAFHFQWFATATAPATTANDDAFPTWMADARVAAEAYQIPNPEFVAP